MLTNLMRRGYITAKSAMLRFKEEEHGGAEFIALIVVIGMVIAMGIVFREQLSKLFADLWNSLTVNQDKKPTLETIADNPF